mgnify:CR=1 FL=1
MLYSHKFPINIFLNVFVSNVNEPIVHVRFYIIIIKLTFYSSF